MPTTKGVPAGPRDTSGGIARQLARMLWEDRLGDLAAMMTYYAIFALFPMAIFVITIALLVVPPSTILEAAAIVTGAMPEQAAALVLDQVVRMQIAADGNIAIGSAVIALWGASRGSVALSRALNSLHEIRETRPWWKLQVTGLLVTLVVAVLLITAMALLVIGPALSGWLAERVGGGAAFHAGWTLARWLGAALLVLLIWAMLYRFLPDTRAPLRVFSPGAVAAVVLWIGVSLLFALFVSKLNGFERTYGTLGAMVMFLAWLWISNIVMLGGAEINNVLERTRQRRRDREEETHGDAGKRRPDVGGRVGQPG